MSCHKINCLGLIAILLDKVFPQCQDVIVQSLDEGFCRVQQRKRIFKSISFRSTVVNSWKEKNTIIQERITAKHKTEGEIEKKDSK